MTNSTMANPGAKNLVKTNKRTNNTVRKHIALTLGFMLVMLAGFQPAAWAQNHGNNPASGSVANQASSVQCTKVLSTNGRQVQFTVSGQMPAQAQVNAVPVQRTAPNGKQVFGAYDITINNGNAEWQPQRGKSVMVSISDPNFTDGQMMNVYHEGSNGNELVATVTSVNHTITFPAKSFSVYIVAGTAGDSRLAVTFVQANGESTTIMVKPNDIDQNDPDDTLYKKILYDPGAGEHPGLIFRGWYSAGSNSNYSYTVEDAAQSMTIEGVRAEVKTLLSNGVTEGDTVYYYALLYKSFTVTYLDNVGTVLSSENYLEMPSVTQRNYKVLQNFTLDDQHTLMGWYVKDGYEENIVGHQPGRLYPNDTTIVITDDVVFTPFLPEGYWLVFDENGKGGTYNAPQFVLSNAVTRRPCADSQMIRYGYTFAGWWTEAEGGSQFTFGNPLTESTTIYAHWTANTTAGYTIIIWKQNVAGDGYDFEESISLTGNVGSTVNTVSQQNSGNDAYARINGTNYQYTGFHLNEYDQNVTITTEGNAVVNVYYDRTQYTLTFQDYTYTQNNNGTYVYWPGGYYRTGNYNYTYYYYPEGYYSRNNSNNSNTDPSPVNNVNNNATVTYYTLNSNGTYTANTYTAHRYNRSTNRTTIKTITAAYEQNILDNFPIVGSNGMTYDDGQRWMPSGSSTFENVIVSVEIMPAENVTFYMDPGSKRPLKTMNWYVEALPGATNTVTAPSTLYDYNYQQITAPSGKTYVLYSSMSARYNGVTKEDFLDISGFQRVGADQYYGVYNNTTYYVWNTTDNQTINFYYTREEYTINFMDGIYVDGNGNEMNETNQGHLHNSQYIAYGADVTSYNEDGDDYYVPTTEGYVLEGWFIDDACTQEYNFTTMPRGGITVYAKWRMIQYRAFLHPNAGTDPTLDWGSESQAMNFRVDYNGTISVPEGLRTGYKWVGWYTDSACTHVFSASTHINETNTVDYDKTSDFTDDMDQWGNGATYNKDVNRFWITKKFEIWGKWRKVVEGADGIGVLYVCGSGTDCPRDNKLYVDNTTAIAESAPTAHADSVFAYWDLQRYDNDQNAYVSSGITVFPGGDFTVLIDNAKFIEYIGDPNDTAYIIQLKAVYAHKEKETPTFIVWYTNDGSGDTLRYDADLHINEAVSIPTPSREGYVFKGWYKQKWQREADVTTSYTTGCDPNFLYYNINNSKYYAEATYQNVADSVAADEANPYDYLYAVWEPILTVEIVGDTATKTYTGSEQSVTGYTVKYYLAGEEVDQPAGVTVTCNTTAEAKGTNVNTNPGYAMGLTMANFTVTVGDNACCTYDADHSSYTDGWLKIKPATLTITAKPQTYTYNGEAQGPVGIYTAGFDTYVTVSGLQGSDALTSITLAGEETDASIYTGVIIPSDAEIGEHTGNYTINYVNGTLTIEQAKLTITAIDQTYTYNGEAQGPAGTYTSDIGTYVTVQGLQGSDALTSITLAGQRTDAGVYPGVIVPSAAEIGENTDNYTVEYVNGKLTINKSDDITLVCPSGNDITKMYDGTALKPAATATGVQADDVIKVEYSTDEENWSETVPGITHVGEQTVYVRASNDNYDTAYCNYKLKVTCRNITLTSATDTKVYNGEELTNSTVTLTGDGFVSGEGYTTEVTGSQTLVGSSENTFTYALNEGTEAGDYCIETVNGTLTVTKSGAITLTCASGEDVTKMYDGDVLNPAATASGVGSDVIKIEYSTDNENWSETVPGITHVGEQTVYVRASNDNYDTAYCNYKLKVTCRNITLTSATDTKVYNGEELTNSTVTLTGDGFVSGEGYTTEVTGSQTLVGSSENTFTYALNEGTLAGDYCIETVNGTLEVTPVETEVVVTIVGNHATNVYDGELHTITGYEIVSISNDLYTVNDFTKPAQDAPVATANRMDVGTTDMTLSADAFANISDNFTNVFFDVTPGYQTITPVEAEIVITAANDIKIYDGTPLTNSGYNYTENVLVGSDVLTAVVEGTITNVGTADNVVTSYMVKRGETDVTDNYTFGESVDGELKVMPRHVTLTSADDEKMYDGTPLTNSTVTVSGDGFAEGEGATYDVTGSQKHAGYSNNEFTYTLNEGTLADNYEITTVLGTLTITKRPLTIKLTASKHYDGEIMEFDQTVFNGVVPDGVTVEVATLETLATGDYLYSGHIETEGSEQGVYTCTAGSFEYMMANAAVQTGFVIKNGDETVNDDYIPEFRVTLTIKEPAVNIECGTPQTVVLMDCEENVQLVDLTAPEMEIADGVSVTITPSIPSGLTALTPGTYTVTWTVTDDVTGEVLDVCDQTVTVTYAPCMSVRYEGYTYNAVRIGSQCWLAENLRVTEVNETPIAHRPVNDDESTVDAYGYLYSWYSAVGVEEGNNDVMPTTYTDDCNGDYVQGICPEGWAVPSQADVNLLRAAVEDNANLLKDLNPQYWVPGSNGTNPNTNFNAHASGHYNSETGRFEGELLYAYFWESDSQPGAAEVWSAVIAYYCDNVQEIISSKDDLRPVRCVRKTTLAPEE